MNRRNFLQKLIKGAPLAMCAPLVVSELVKAQKPKAPGILIHRGNYELEFVKGMPVHKALFLRADGTTFVEV